jgi:23S rRNA (guanine745-N1)-methyltransferase
MRAEFVQMLRCPQCIADDDTSADIDEPSDAGLTDPDAITESLEPRLMLAEGALRCGRGHSFDVARQGYVTLLDPAGSRPPEGDTTAMVAAREEFLGAGHFAALDEALVDAVRGGLGFVPPSPLPLALRGTSPSKPDGAPASGLARAPGGGVVDLGAGTGYHTAQVLDALPDHFGLALDISVAASRRAARTHERLGAVRCDAWRRLPIRTASAAVVLNVFAPRNGAEIRRILLPDGVLVVVTPTRRHLAELIGPQGPLAAHGLLTIDPRKEERLGRALDGHMHLRRRDVSEVRVSLSRTEMLAAVAMGPSAHHADLDALAGALAAVPEPLPVTVSVTVSVYGARLS